MTKELQAEVDRLCKLKGWPDYYISANEYTEILLKAKENIFKTKK